ncbi:unnamed protein product [Orchesella dallaii]|uniref:Uncharacterized protein n=1 Tax=Orchesella dallaii TaxID=48710 RepID=A0ABP1Q683_9HEXA
MKERSAGPRQNSYPPVASSPTQPPQNLGISQQSGGMQSPLQSPMQTPSSMQPPQMVYSPSQTQPIQLLHQNVYVKQEPNVVSSPPPQYYYEMLAAQQQQALVNPNNQPQIVQYSGGGIINNEPNDQALNSDFSLPNLSDVNLSLLDQHLSQNLNDMNINNF